MSPGRPDVQSLKTNDWLVYLSLDNKFKLGTNFIHIGSLQILLQEINLKMNGGFERLGRVCSMELS